MSGSCPRALGPRRSISTLLAIQRSDPYSMNGRWLGWVPRKCGRPLQIVVAQRSLNALRQLCATFLTVKATHADTGQPTRNALVSDPGGYQFRNAKVHRAPRARVWRVAHA